MKSGRNISKQCSRTLKICGYDHKESTCFHFIDFSLQHIPLSTAKCAIQPLLRRQKPLYCLLSPPSPSLNLVISLSFCSSHASFIFPFSFAFFRRLCLNLSLPVAVRGGSDDHLQPSCPPPRHLETGWDGSVDTRTHTHMHALCLYRVENRAAKEEETRIEGRGGAAAKERGRGI